MDAQLPSLISALHGAGRRWVLALTGGGAGAASWLLSVPGGSRSVLEVLIPYDEQSLSAFLGCRPTSFCSADTAHRMAGRALERARWLAPGQPAVGVACTASLRSDRPKRGEHRFHIAIQTAERTLALALTLTKGARERAEEEDVLDRVLLNALAEVLGVSERAPVPLLTGEEVCRQELPAASLLDQLLRGEFAALSVEPDGRLRADAVRPRLLLPGSFNPLHAGHCGLAVAAAHIVGSPAAYELSVVNADKPPLTAEEVRRRLAAFGWRAPVWLTRAATFAEKALLFPGAVFVVGADTAERVVQARFYGGKDARMAEALGALRAQGCRFLVAGRSSASGSFLSLDDLAIPTACRDLFTAIPVGAFRLDVCSTDLRGERSA